MSYRFVFRIFAFGVYSVVHFYIFFYILSTNLNLTLFYRTLNYHSGKLMNWLLQKILYNQFCIT